MAAQPKEVITRSGKYTEHGEWHLLQGGPNSLVAQLTARTYGQNSCLILFTLSSPCSTKCLREAGRSNIVQMTSAAFSAIDNNYKAFVFQKIFDYDMKPEVTRQDLLDAWHQLRNVPLLRCDNNGGWDCAVMNPENNPCLAGKRHDEAGLRTMWGSLFHRSPLWCMRFWLAECNRNTSQLATKLQSRTSF